MKARAVGSIRGYVDESGDTGFHLRDSERRRVGGSSAIFWLALVLVGDPLPFGPALQELRDRWRRSASREFKFSKMPDSKRREFFHHIAKLPFDARVGYVVKDRVRAQEFRDHQRLMQHVLCGLLELTPSPNNRLSIMLDEATQDKRYQKRFCRDLEDVLESHFFEHRLEVRASFCTSQSEPLIQLADMVVGAISHEAFKGGGAYTAGLPTGRIRVVDLTPDDTCT